MVRAQVRVALAEQVLGQAVGTAGQGRGAHETRASTHHVALLWHLGALRPSLTGVDFELNADFEIMSLGL